MATQDKYDRQVRIWGQHGQQILHNSSVLLLGCDPVGVETLKNLVLPGIGHITIVDDEIITEADVENNFFTPQLYLGKQRGEVVLELLLEMNPDVKGIWLKKINLDINNDHFSLVIANERDFLQSNYKLIQLNTYGFIGKMRIYSPKCFIIETKPMGQKIDLRIANPFPLFLEYYQTIDFNNADQNQIAHIPYIFIIRKALLEFQKKYNKFPSTYHERNYLMNEEIKILSQVLPYEYRANFEEASQNLSQLSVNDEWKYVLEDIGEGNDEFHQLCSGLKKFVQKHNQPPLQRYFPDMKCFTETYVHLKNKVYGQKIEEDYFEFQSILKSLGNQSSEETIRIFIDNVSNLKYIKYRTISDEQELPLKVEDTESDCYQWYIALNTLKLFKNKYQKYPTFDDLQEMIKLSLPESEKLGVEQIDENILYEICRYQGAKLHMIASILGGMASQEAIKLLTNQFVPINNTLIFNGLKGEACIYEF